jgi:hypothetical protein
MEPTLTPTGLAFDFLAINSVRGEIVGHDEATDLCVRAIWDFSANPVATGQRCGDFVEGHPYVAISSGRCDADVRYWGNADLISGAGCFDFSAGSVDATLRVKSKLFTGTIRLKSPP